VQARCLQGQGEKSGEPEERGEDIGLAVAEPCTGRPQVNADRTAEQWLGDPGAGLRGHDSRLLAVVTRRLRWLDGEAPFRPIILRGIILRGIILRRIVLRRIVVRSVRRTFGVLRIVRSVLRAFFLALLVSVGILVLVLVVLRSFDRSLGLLALVAVAVIGGSLGL